jgi:hypothetical protein
LKHCLRRVLNLSSQTQNKLKQKISSFKLYSQQNSYFFHLTFFTTSSHETSPIIWALQVLK